MTEGRGSQSNNNGAQKEVNLCAPRCRQVRREENGMMILREHDAEKGERGDEASRKEREGKGRRRSATSFFTGHTSFKRTGDGRRSNHADPSLPKHGG